MRPGLFSLKWLHFSVPPSPASFSLGKESQGVAPTSPNLLPAPPWPGRSFTHSPSSSSSPEAGAGFSLQPGGGGGSAGTQASHFPFRPFLLEVLPHPPRSCGLPSVHIVFPRCFVYFSSLWFAGGLGPGAGKGLRFPAPSTLPGLTTQQFSVSLPPVAAGRRQLCAFGQVKLVPPGG